MGNRSSVDHGNNSRQSSMNRAGSSSGWQHDDTQSSYSWYAQNYPQPVQQQPYTEGYRPQNEYYSHQQTYTPTRNVGPPSRLDAPHNRKYGRIADNYHSLEEVTEALRQSGLESSNLIVGVDFTKSNEWTGKRSYNGRSLHNLGRDLNPYEQAISIIGKTLSSFDDDNLIPCFGFGDASTHDQDVFSFNPDGRFCVGFEEVLSRYREIVPHLKLAGPTSFAPVIEMAMTIVEQSRGQYHVLLIIADGQVTRSVDTATGHLSPQERRTVQAIVEASKFPLSIVLVGVGDGPWDMMKEFDDNIPARDFDNFQFVNFTEIMSKTAPQSRKEAEFSLAALMEIPSQYKATMDLDLLRECEGNSPQRIALPPPIYGAGLSSHPKPSYGSSFQHSSSFQHQRIPSPSYKPNVPARSASIPISTYENQVCPVCLSSPKDMAFGCGHQTCRDCGQELSQCPICRTPVETRIRLY